MGELPAARLALTSAQISALECRGLEAPTDDGEVLLARCFQGRALVFGPEDRDAVFMALTEASNAEDAAADPRNGQPAELRRFARRASISLAALALRVLRAA